MNIEFSLINFVVDDRATKAPKRILSDVSGTIRCGCLTAIMGPSGAGKSTLVCAGSLPHHAHACLVVGGGVGGCAGLTPMWGG